jgi:1,4-alpha-glucan branching enzyme
VPHDDYRVGLPYPGEWEEILNTDAETYAGSGVGNYGSVTAVEGAWSGQPAHATIVVPPLATVWLRRRA